jgi:trigger factor
MVLNEGIDAKILPAIIKDLGMDPSNASSGTGRYRMTIDKVALVEKVPMDKTLFDKVYPGRSIESEEDFMNELRNEMQSYFGHQARQKLHNDLFERLVHETKIELPETFLKKWMSEGGEKYKSPEEVEREWSSFDHQLRWQLITDRLMEEHKLSVDQDELEQGARAQIMSYFGQMGAMSSMNDTEWMEPLVKKQLQDSKFRNELQDRIITDKLFNQLESMIKMAEKEPGTDYGRAQQLATGTLNTAINDNKVGTNDAKRVADINKRDIISHAPGYNAGSNLPATPAVPVLTELPE